MDYISVKKVATNLGIDYYQIKSYIEYLNLEIKEIGKIPSILSKDLEIVFKLAKNYTTNQIAYMKSHDIQPFFDGMLLLDLRKKYNLNEKQFKNKCANASLEFKYVYSDEECKKFNEFMNGKSNLNRAELRDLKYVNNGWIPLRNIFKEFGEKYDFSENTGDKILEYLKIEIYKPSHQFAFINKEQKKQFEDFLKKFNSPLERRLFFQKKTCMEKYDADNPSRFDEARNKISDSSKRKINFAKNKNLITVKELANMFDKDKHTIIDVILMLNIKIITFETDNHYYISKDDIFMLKDYFLKTGMSGTSYSEKEIADFIKSI